jgi:hypothetical protein
MTYRILLESGDAILQEDGSSFILNETPNFDLVVQDALHGHLAENLAMTQVHLIAVQDTTHGHLADNLTLVQQHTDTQPRTSR